MKTRLVKLNGTYGEFIRSVGQKIIADEKAKRDGLMGSGRQGVDHIHIKKMPHVRKNMRRGF